MTRRLPRAKAHREGAFAPSLWASHRREGEGIRITGACRAPAAAVYGLLADPISHLEWGGRRQHRYFRLVSLDASDRPARAGTEFDSTGRSLLSRFVDRSVVTEARPDSVFEFVTDTRSHRRLRRRVVTATIVHRYEIAATGPECLLTYSAKVVDLEGRPGGRGIALLLSRWARLHERGFRSLVHAAEQQGGRAPVTG